MSGRSPYTYHLAATVPAQAGATTGGAIILGESPDAGVVSEVSILPAAAVVANATNFRTWTVFNRGTAGAGTTVVATMTTATTGLVDNDERLMTLSVTAADLVVAADDVLELVETTAAAGVAHGGYRVDCSIART